jgi:hypothetical protein
MTIIERDGDVTISDIDQDVTIDMSPYANENGLIRTLTLVVKPGTTPASKVDLACDKPLIVTTMNQVGVVVRLPVKETAR